MNGNGIEVDRVLGVVISYNNVYNNEASGIKIVRTASDANIEISHNTIIDNEIGILSENWLQEAISTANVTVICNDIENNNNYGVLNSVAATIDAENNWWSHISGPFHSTNPTGTGNQVSDNIDFDPWLPALFNLCSICDWSYSGTIPSSVVGGHFIPKNMLIMLLPYLVLACILVIVKLRLLH